MEIRPNYFDKFKCVSKACKHNCCIGWEIDIDADTLQKYNNVAGPLKQKLQKNIALKPCAHFILAENERCPFLNDENLCELILQGGEDMLCQICSDHPRFYNEIYGVLEKGVGLCCEAAAKIILESTDSFKLVCDGEMPQNDFYTQRNEIFAILGDRTKPLNTRINELLKATNTDLPLDKDDWISIYKKLERLDTGWDNCLDSIKAINKDIPKSLEIPCEQLLCYFIYRHLSGGFDDFLFTERIQFAVLSCYLITSVNKSKTVDEMLEIARMYSSEIEYSDENINLLLEKLYDCNNLKTAP